MRKYACEETARLDVCMYLLNMKWYFSPVGLTTFAENDNMARLNDRNESKNKLSDVERNTRISQ